MACLDCVFDLCEITVECGGGNVTTPIEILADNQLISMMLDYQGKVRVINSLFNNGDKVVFDLESLSADYAYECYFVNQAGERLTYLHDGVEYGRFKFTTKQILTA